MAKEAFRMAQLEESPGELLLQEAKRRDADSWKKSGMFWNRAPRQRLDPFVRHRMVEKSSAYHQAYKEAVEDRAGNLSRSERSQVNSWMHIYILHRWTFHYIIDVQSSTYIYIYIKIQIYIYI